jgi:hypothetical protein
MAVAGPSFDVSRPHTRSTSTSTTAWEQERAAVFEAICALRALCEALDDRFAELQKGPWHSVFRAMVKWGDAKCARIEQESLQQQREEEPLAGH